MIKWVFRKTRAAALGQFDVHSYRAMVCRAAVRHEDCGPCTQLGVKMAERAGVSPGVLRAVLADHIDAMPPDVALVWKFTRAALAHDAFADEYREPVVKRSGRASLYRYAGIGACAARRVRWSLAAGAGCRHGCPRP